MAEGNEDKDELMFDEVTGARNKRTILSALNKKRLGKHDMDDIFDDWY